MHKGSLRLLIITAVLICGASREALAAPSCSSLFETRSSSTFDLSGTLDDLARLRLELDNALTLGNLEFDPILKSAQYDFANKLESLRLTTKLSEAEIKQLLIKRIQKLQNRNIEVKAEAAKARADHNASLGIFIFKKSIKLNSISQFHDLTYLPEYKKFSLYMMDGPRFIHLEDGRFEFGLGFLKGFKMFPDHKHGLAIRPGAIEVYEMGSQTLLKTIETEIKFTDGAAIDFSPSAQQVLLTQKFGKSFLLNLDSGTISEAYLPREMQLSTWQKDGQFIDEQTALFVTNTKIARVDLSTGIKVVKEVFENLAQNALLSADRKTVLVYSSDKMVALDTTTLEPVSPVVDYQDQNLFIAEAARIPHSNSIFVRLRNRSTIEDHFADEKTIPQFEFAKPFPLSYLTSKIIFSLDGNDAFVLIQDKGNRIDHFQK